MSLEFSGEVKSRFPDLRVDLIHLAGVKVEKRSRELEGFKEEVYERVRRSYTLENLRDVKVFRAYRDFFWSIDVDPTKIRPAAEALIRRILGGRPIPQINTLVDSYNLASIDTEIALAAFDSEKLRGGLMMRFAKLGEEFLGIGMNAPMHLRGGEVVISDEDRLVAVYPYRDADYSKITEHTGRVTLLVCGVPGIEDEKLKKAGDTAVSYVTRFCGGST